MITYHLIYPHPTTESQWMSVVLSPATTRQEAIVLLRALPSGSQLLYTVNSAAELERQTSAGQSWAKRLFHTHGIPESKAKRRAVRRWSQLVLERS